VAMPETTTPTRQEPNTPEEKLEQLEAQLAEEQQHAAVYEGDIAASKEETRGHEQKLAASKTDIATTQLAIAAVKKTMGEIKQTTSSYDKDHENAVVGVAEERTYVQTRENHLEEVLSTQEQQAVKAARDGVDAWIKDLESSVQMAKTRLDASATALQDATTTLKNATAGYGALKDYMKALRKDLEGGVGELHKEVEKEWSTRPRIAYFLLADMKELLDSVKAELDAETPEKYWIDLNKAAVALASATEKEKQAKDAWEKAKPALAAAEKALADARAARRQTIIKKIGEIPTTDG
jgi:BMFP domain-containing protein YqiC